MIFTIHKLALKEICRNIVIRKEDIKMKIQIERLDVKKMHDIRKQFKINRRNVYLLGEIGRGATSYVFKAFFNNEIVAVKQFRSCISIPEAEILKYTKFMYNFKICK